MLITTALFISAALLTGEQHDCVVDRLQEWLKSPNQLPTMKSAAAEVRIAAYVCGVTENAVIETNSMEIAKEHAPPVYKRRR